MRISGLCIVLLLLVSPAVPAASGPRDTCAAIADAAAEAGLAPALLTRVLWEETRLKDAGAIPFAARALADLQAEFGNPGLAALAYSGGRIQAETFIRGEGIPMDTLDFVILTTGLPAGVWRDAPPDKPLFRLSGNTGFAEACTELVRGSWGTPLPEVTAVAVPPVTVEPVRLHPSMRSLRPRMRPKPKLGKWGAQLAFGKSRELARKNFVRTTGACRDTVGLTPDVVFVENRVRGRPGYWMARVSRMDRDAAEDICRAARQRGCSCVVYRNY